jgi:hypothetical protein
MCDGQMSMAVLKIQQGKEPSEDLRGLNGCPSR